MAHIIKRNHHEGALGLDVPSVSGRYQITAHKLDGRSRVLADWFDNLILDNGLVELGARSVVTTCAVGTGNSTPAATQTTLDAVLTSTTTINSTNYGAASTAPYYGWCQRTYRFSVGQAAGTLTEVGVGWSGSTLFSRSLIKDSGGAPTEITVLADEVLDVTYELRLYVPATDSVTQVVINGVTHTVTTRAFNAAGLNGWAYASTPTNLIGERVYLKPSPLGSWATYPAAVQLGAITTSGLNVPLLSQFFGNASSVWVDTPYAGNMTSMQGVIMGLNDSNDVSGIGGMMLATSMLGSYQIKFDPPIPKTASHTLRLNFSASWTRYTPPI
jgi:hypothetical protein